MTAPAALRPRSAGAPPPPTGVRVGSPADIARLALPALGALLAEPAFVLADNAMVGHLGAQPLAGVAVAGNLLGALVNCCVFLAYATTATAARRVGAGDEAGAVRAGVDGLALGLFLGALLGVVTWAVAPPGVHAMGATGAVAHNAVLYLRISAAGLPGVLVATAAAGVLRGLRRSGTTLAVVAVGFAANALLNALLLFAFRLGVAGSALGTVIAQTAMGAVYAVIVARRARRHRVSLVPRPAEMLRAAASGLPLVVRTVTMRAVIVALAAGATALGAVPLAAYQLGFSLWMFAALALDAVAVAAQTVVGGLLGAGEARRARAAMRKMVLWSLAGGALCGAVLLVARPLYLPLLAADPGVRDALSHSLLPIALLQPLAGAVYILDGVLIGAGDGRYLAAAGAGTALLSIPAALLLPGTAAALTGVWCVFGFFLLVRLVFLAARARGDAWIRLGS
ncbi:MATE family efflux transporter [Streptacidiphilus sp. N1-3]|uniref:MATE family efflux transporter n=1 Tax=Streptacidiphilus alkalitolerans TaxID=3342712 RepID=A0ABV6WYH2_9ACTN